MEKTDQSAAPEGHKWCGSCKTAKPVAEFGACKTRADGRAHRCKECDREASRQYRERNPEKRKATLVAHNAKVKSGIPTERESADRNLKAFLENGKVCARCGRHKPPEAFVLRNYTNASGETKQAPNSYCRACSTEQARESRLKNPQVMIASNKRRTERMNQADPVRAARSARLARLKPFELDGVTVKRCGVCDQVFPTTAFHHAPSQSHPDSACPKCANERKIAANARWRATEKGAEAIKAAHADRRVRRSPSRYWGHGEVNEIYANARALTRRTGVRHHVDHILPIKHPLVSGLHVPENLQILTARDNSRKRNKIPAELAHLFADLPKEWVWTR